MDHAAFLRSLSAEDRERLTERADGPAVLRLGLHAALILGLGTAIAYGVPFWWALLLPQGILLAFLFNLSHECTHRTPFRTERLNESVGAVTGALLVQPFLWFRYFHLAHHRFTNDPERDPELVGAPKPRTWADYALYLSCVPYWRAKIAVLRENAFGTIDASYVPEARRPDLRREARLLVALYAALAAGTLAWGPLLLWTWLLPLALGFPVLKLYHLAEHGLCPHVADMFRNSRTVLTGPLARFVTWNMPFLAEHHALPTVPFHRLPDLHVRARDHLRETSDGYAAFTRRYAATLGTRTP